MMRETDQDDRLIYSRSVPTTEQSYAKQNHRIQLKKEILFEWITIESKRALRMQGSFFRL